ncbi:MAG: hypothetical protein AB7Q42_10415 [Acidimicrobiia bacterium]
MTDVDDDHLADVLASVGALLVTVPDAAPLVTPSRKPAMGRLAHRRRWQWAPVIVAIATATVLLVAPLRSAVAGWLGIGSTSIRIDPSSASTLAPLPSIDAGLSRIDRATAEARLGSLPPALDTTALGTPDGFATMPEGGVLVVWPDSSTLWIHSANGEPDVLFHKLVAAGEQVDRVDDLGDEAIVISGGHVLRTPHRTIAATTVVLWQSGSREHRLESDRDAPEVIELARQLANGT